MDSVPLTIEEEEESIETFLQVEKTRRLNLNPEINPDDLDKELRIQWPALDIATKRHYLSNKLEILNLESTYKASCLCDSCVIWSTGDCSYLALFYKSSRVKIMHYPIS